MSESYLSILEKLIGFNTTSHLSNLQLLGYIEDLVAPLGATVARFPSADGLKANLLVTIGPMTGGGVVLSGHTDVVPVEGQSWDSDPFAMIEDGGLVFGRGAVDMKAFLAVCLSLAPLASRSNLTRPLHLAFSYDEEVGCTGVAPMITYIAKSLPLPSAVIIGEPTGMNLVTAHKGAYDWRTSVRGVEAHSSLPDKGAHAIFAAGRLITFLEESGHRHRMSPLANSKYEAPYLTASVGLISGGTAGNVIPGHCTFDWEIRTVLAGQSDEFFREFEAYAGEVVLPRLRRSTPEPSIVSTSLFGVPPLVPERDGHAEWLVRNIKGDNDAGAVPFCTEGGLFQAAGLSTVVIGPGSIEQAHRPNEFISLSQLAECDRFLKRVIQRLASP